LLDIISPLGSETCSFLLCQVLSPCGLGDILCGKAHKWISNGTELCRLAGFSVQVSEARSGAVDDVFCYGGKASLDSISDSWTSSKDRPTLSSVVSWDLQDFQRWATEMPVSERVSWAIGGMVLTAGLIFLRFLYFFPPFHILCTQIGKT
jgi:hypothetical protein